MNCPCPLFGPTIKVFFELSVSLVLHAPLVLATHSNLWEASVEV